MAVSDANKGMLGSFIRHVATAGGAYAGIEGFQTEDWRIALIGAVVVIAGMLFSYLEKKERS